MLNAGLIRAASWDAGWVKKENPSDPPSGRGDNHTAFSPTENLQAILVTVSTVRDESENQEIDRELWTAF